MDHPAAESILVLERCHSQVGFRRHRRPPQPLMILVSKRLKEPFIVQPGIQFGKILRESKYLRWQQLL